MASDPRRDCLRPGDALAPGQARREEPLRVGHRSRVVLCDDEGDTGGNRVMRKAYAYKVKREFRTDFSFRCK